MDDGHALLTVNEQVNEMTCAELHPELQKSATVDQRTSHCVQAHMHSRRLLKKCCWSLEMIASIPKLPLFFVFRDHKDRVFTDAVVTCGERSAVLNVCGNLFP